MRDIEKMNMTHGASSRRIRRRKRGRSLYALFVVILAFAIVVTLSMTVFFNIRVIRVTGNAEYDPEEIVEKVGVSEGDNMMRLSLPALEAKAEEQLLNAETVTIRRQFPSTLVIDVQQAVPAYNVSYEYGTLIVSKKNKILRNSMDPDPELVSIIGYLPEETTPGKHLTAAEERYDKILSAFQELLQENQLEVPIVSVNLTDLNDIIVNFDNRIEFDMGNWSEINYKISFAEQVIAKQPDGKEGYLTMIGTNQCSFRNKADVLNAEKNAERRAIAQQEAEAESAENLENSEIPETPEIPQENTDIPENVPEIPEQLE
ncbi:MAG: FtsQ-type POTRA domain-containing protein [Oscillospiraceae bacterium]|nr:FtsQ-type POTRA domain-containing protein [Oscillospiraceae bacterium]